MEALRFLVNGRYRVHPAMSPLTASTGCINGAQAPFSFLERKCKGREGYRREMEAVRRRGARDELARSLRVGCLPSVTP